MNKCNIIKNIYTNIAANQCEQTCSLFQHDFPKLLQEKKKLCDQNVTIEEVGKSLKKLPKNKAPGTDGFSSDL